MSNSRSLKQWLDAYGESHRHPTNKLIHWICVPLIAYSLIALSTLVPTFLPADYLLFTNLGHLLVAAAFIFYWRLSPPMALAMLLFGLLCLWLASWAKLSPVPLWESALSIFIAAWLGQFYGHKLEGKKPSFFEDLQFLMIGPAWLMADLFRKMDWKY